MRSEKDMKLDLMREKERQEQQFKTQEDYRNMYDFHLGSSKPDFPVYFGSAKNVENIRKQIMDKLVNLDQQSYEECTEKYQILCSEAKGRKAIDRKYNDPAPCEWTIEKNEAFWAGAMRMNRTFVLTNSIENYFDNINEVISKKSKTSAKGTVNELIWLMDNGYSFRQDEENNLIAKRSASSFSDIKIDNKIYGQPNNDSDHVSNRCKALRAQLESDLTINITPKNESDFDKNKDIVFSKVSRPFFMTKKGSGSTINTWNILSEKKGNEQPPQVGDNSDTDWITVKK